MTQLLHPNGNDVAHVTKEAVASAIVYRMYDQLRGAGSTGRIIYREKPSKVIHTQHLLPRREPSPTATTYAEKDDVTSPAHIGTTGLTFQIADRKDRAITVSIRACIYLRMLPSGRSRGFKSCFPSREECALGHLKASSGGAAQSRRREQGGFG